MLPRSVLQRTGETPPGVSESLSVKTAVLRDCVAVDGLSPLEFEILRSFGSGSVTQGAELWRGSREELPVFWWPSMCYLQGPHLSVFARWEGQRSELS